MRQFDGLTPYKGRLWRVIEGQYRSSTLRLVDTFAEHDVLESLLEASKPPVPPECQHLDYQFWSPFRYGCYPRDSRFRRRGRTPGVWYGSEVPLTAMCEMLWGNLRFFRASVGTPLPRRPVEYSAVCADIAAALSLDLTQGDWPAKGNWGSENYTDCLALADDLRAAGGEALRYASARAPDAGANVAVFSCAGFAAPQPLGLQTWHVLYSDYLQRVTCETDGTRHSLALRGTRFSYET